MAGNGHQRIVLASASEARRRVLAGAGIAFSIEVSGIDEGAIRSALLDGGDEISPDDLAEVLARAKAQDVSERLTDALVIGGDQILSLEGRIFEKARSDEEVRAQLLDLRGKTHALTSAVVLASNGAVDWVHVDTAYVTMRQFSASFLGQYMAMAGPAVRDSVGCYHLEGVGAQLIENVSGDSFTVLGLPLFPLMGALRDRGLLVT